MKARKKWSRPYTMKLQCGQCGQFFHTKRWRKYCKPVCANMANAIKGRMRYWEMRDAVLKARGKNK